MLRVCTSSCFRTFAFACHACARACALSVDTPVSEVIHETEKVSATRLCWNLRPDLDETQRIGSILVVFGVRNTRSSGHELDRASAECLCCAHGVFVRQIALHNVRDDLKSKVRVRKMWVRLKTHDLHRHAFELTRTVIGNS